MLSGLNALLLFTITEPNTSHDYSVELLFHGFNVASVAVLIADALGASKVSKKDKIRLHTLSVIHDIGKSMISTEILYESGRLNEEEFLLMRQHPLYSEDIFLNFLQHDSESSSYDVVKRDAEIIRYHHERWDGTGYPVGLVGEQIPYLARIITIADAFDAMVSRRVYHTHAHKDPVGEIKRCAGTQFDPEIVEACVPALTALYNKIRDNDRNEQEELIAKSIIKERTELLKALGVEHDPTKVSNRLATAKSVTLDVSAKPTEEVCKLVIVATEGVD